MKKINVLLFLIVWVTFAHIALGDDDTVKLSGKALYSFSPSYTLLLTENYIYKIVSTEISKKDLEDLNNSAIQNKPIAINIPRSSIEFLWPTHPNKTEEEAAIKFRAVSAELQNEAKANAGELAIKGKTAVSFSEPFFLIQSNEKVFQIKKSKLSHEQIKLISSVGVGGNVNAVVPENAIELAWSIKQPKYSKAPQHKEAYSLNKNGISIDGVVLLSFNEPLVLIQSKEIIFQLKKGRIQTRVPSALDVPGSFVRVRAPISALNFAWPNSLDDSKIKFESQVHFD